ncbi:MAG: phosphatidylglycerol lysyltransferase domain-containing protein [Eubacteriales bacterium]|nr:phosphatidylglycerol lysyltransferase domain-containing protein [Eubacteriales bacterium]
MNIEFKKVSLEDRELINRYLAMQKTRSCELTFANIYLWSAYYRVDYAIVEDTLVFRGSESTVFFDFPIGHSQKLRPALEALMQYCREQGQEFVLGLVTPEKFALLEELYPGVFEIEYDRDAADYVYETEKLANLSGKKYHGKKNHINKFLRTYPEWKYETIDDSNVEDCFQMALAWRRLNGCEEDEEKTAEMCVTLNSLRLMKELELRGGLLRVNGEVVAFSIGEPVCDDTMVVHIEKAFSAVDGAYPMINQQFVLHEAMEYTYVNREEDLGEEGLRRAKLSYHPVFMVEKGTVRLKER